MLSAPTCGSTFLRTYVLLLLIFCWSSHFFVTSLLIDSFSLLQATDDYILQMAKLFKKLVGPGLIVYLEFSNEVWNSQFQVFCGFCFSSTILHLVFLLILFHLLFFYIYICIFNEYCRSPKIHT